MATKNDFLLLEQKCIKQYELALPYLSVMKSNEGFSDTMKARFGFYLLLLKMYTNLLEYNELIEIITDTDFNSKIFDKPDVDEGVDAVYIDEEHKEIKLFNFKYRESYNPDRSTSLDGALASSKFLTALATQNNNLIGKMQRCAQDVLDRLNSKEIWNISLYLISNDSHPLAITDHNIENLCDIYGLSICSVGLDEIVDELSLRPRNIDATLLLDQDVVMKFQEDDLTSNTSYIVNLLLPELIRITCDNQDVRNKYNWEHDSELKNVKMDYQVLYDNVRGFIGKTRFNHNIENTLDEDPKKFFYYNNGITIVADDIHVEETNLRKKFKLIIKNLQVINGGQTLRTIHNFHTRNNGVFSEAFSQARIMVRLFKVNHDDLKSCIAEYNNSQNSISQRDLKSLRKEQIQLEEYLGQNGILYERKRGDTGEKNNNYNTIIGMELMGQILLSVSGFPEQISNKKREIFNSYYSKLFTDNESLLSIRTVDLIKKYREIEMSYIHSNFKPTVQKQLYILYLSDSLSLSNYNKLIEKFESFIQEYASKIPDDKRKSEARYLIELNFREKVTAYFQNPTLFNESIQ